MNEPVIVDTGPLVAFLLPREQHHAWTVDRLREIEPPLLTCEPVLSEAFFLVSKLPRARDRLIALLDRREVELGYNLSDDLNGVLALMRRYAGSSRPMSLADACLVRMAEQHSNSRVLTLDRKDFLVYRTIGGEPISLIVPDPAM